jgi:hypothetical protein|tara:strand:- start:258 stop:404 length:147 start_codon:yes stop_codon:yes gene_type:complete
MLLFKLALNNNFKGIYETIEENFVMNGEKISLKNTMAKAKKILNIKEK